MTARRMSPSPSRRRLLSALAGLVAMLPASAMGQLPSVHVIATGGTIASSASGTVGVDRLIAGVPELAEVADLSFEQVLRTGSSRITPDDWLELARSVRQAFSTRPGLSGVVITHGTDSMEETAYFLDLVDLGTDRPVVVTGAMRSADAIGPDGPANLHNAVRLAADDGATGWGVLVMMNDEIHRARDVTKTSTLRVHAFESPVVGAIGVVDAEGPVFMRAKADRPPRFPVDHVVQLPRVEIDLSFVGATGSAIRQAIQVGAGGVVVASFGSGRVTAGQAEAIGQAAEAGLPVVISSRVGSGRVEDAYGGGLGAAGRGVILAEDLNPAKARVLLMVALTRSADPAALSRAFRSY